MREESKMPKRVVHKVELGDKVVQVQFAQNDAHDEEVSVALFSPITLRDPLDELPAAFGKLNQWVKRPSVEGKPSFVEFIASGHRLGGVISLADLNSSLARIFAREKVPAPEVRDRGDDLYSVRMPTAIYELVKSRVLTPGGTDKSR